MIYYTKNVSSVHPGATRAKRDDLSATNALREHPLLGKIPRTLQLVKVKSINKKNSVKVTCSNDLKFENQLVIFLYTKKRTCAVYISKLKSGFSMAA